MGRLARTRLQKPRSARRGTHLSRMNVRRAFVLAAVLIFGIALPVLSQSGRRNEPGKGPKPNPGPIAEPTRNTSTSRPESKPSDEVDSDDVVRISSNLVPIPVSVVDRLGNAVVNLKLEDFEL